MLLSMSLIISIIISFLFVCGKRKIIA